MTQSSIDDAEVAKFRAMAAEWWDPAGKFKPLHMLNPVRLEYVVGQIAAEFARDRKSLRPFEGLRLLDIGCGWGPLTLALALAAPDAVVTAVDVNDRSLRLTAENARELGLPGVQTLRPEDVPEDRTFDTIWSNPPIRVGKDALHEILTTWLPRLSPGGTAWLVVQKNLGGDSLQRWLADTLGEGFTVARAATNKGFRIITVQRD